MIARFAVCLFFFVAITLVRFDGIIFKILTSFRCCELWTDKWKWIYRRKYWNRHKNCHKRNNSGNIITLHAFVKPINSNRTDDDQCSKRSARIKRALAYITSHPEFMYIFCCPFHLISVFFCLEYLIWWHL